LRLLLDTHLLLWLSEDSDRLSRSARELIGDPDNTIVFSVASLWEASIKHSLQRPDYDAPPAVLRQAFLERGFEELDVRGPHAMAVAALPLLHRDPFDRMLLAQAMVEQLTFLTTDRILAAYPGPIQRV